jgi:2-dehydro-3-deoxy-D-arabinonate dehydratase
MNGNEERRGENRVYLTKHSTPEGARWALDGQYLPWGWTLGQLLACPKEAMLNILKAIPKDEEATGPLLAPVEADQEIWASGVTYQRSRDARKAESQVADVYQLVYEAVRPELFLKGVGHRARGHGVPIRVRRDSSWNVPEPELTLVVNSYSEIVGWCVGNDVSSRSIEGENPLYLPQAKIYRGSCSIGPGIRLVRSEISTDLTIHIDILRESTVAFTGETSLTQMKRSLTELVTYLSKELDFPQGVLLMTGTGIIPPAEFTLCAGDTVSISIDDLTLENSVED